MAGRFGAKDRGRAELAREFDAILVPLDTIFWKAAEQREAAFWRFDGIHPTPAGAALIAHSWLSAVHAL